MMRLDNFKMAQNKQLKDGVKKVKELVDKGYFEKVEYHALRVVATVMALSLMTKVLTRELGSLNLFAMNLNLEELKPLFPYVIAISLAGLVLFVTITLFVKFLTSKRTESARIWSSIIAAFVGALDQSSFKPHQGPARRHERLN